jgi:hypothetical protein
VVNAGLMLYNKSVSEEQEVEKFRWPDADCHYIHQRCRHICHDRLALKERNEDGVQHGYAYCNQFGSVTQKGGVTLAATWAVQGCPHDLERETKKHEKLCCGHTTIPLDGNNNPVRVFGWNPDCQAQGFVIGNN